MKTRIFLTALLLSLALPAAADFRTIVEGYEVSVRDIRLPQTKSGTIAFRRCSECPYQTKRVAGDVSWEVDGQAVSLEKFRVALAQIRAYGEWTMTVGHHLERDVIVRVTVLVPKPVSRN
jgi:hypothetical protein